ncbi:MAG: hypothetical protein DMF69_08765 [Acidobacteria bacterium]|nr:MAG: hypothetical protein DMF69_08765 [Acidobacteriota bacterium]
MKKQKRQRMKQVTKGRRLSIVSLTIAAVVVAGAAITVLSRQAARDKVSAANQPTLAAAESGKKYVTVKVAGRDVQVDPQTGNIKPLTPEEAQQLAAGLKTMLNRSTEGLEEVHNADGSVSVDLQGRFQNVTLARTNEDGTVERSCVDDPQAAAEFLGIDPQLIDGSTPKANTNRPVTRTPAKRVSQ